MIRSGLFVLAAVVSIGAVACDRGNKSSETTTTSASQETIPTVDPNSLPSVPNTDENTANTNKNTATTPNVNRGASNAGKGTGTDTNGSDPSTGGRFVTRDAGVSNDYRNDRFAAPPAGGTLGVDNSVAPGHIITPPGGGKATGEPNSAGSHNIGATH